MRRGSTRPGTPDLFSTAPVQEPSTLFATIAKSADKKTAVASPSSRYVLPKDLAAAIKQLNDAELDKLFAAARAEQERRGRKPVEASSNKRQGELMRATLTPSKINAVRAAFRAGIKPSQIARQFGISQTDVRKVLAGGSR